MARQGASRMVMCVPGFCPETTQVLPGRHSSFVGTRTAGGDSGIAPGPVSLSGSRNSPAARSTSFHCRDSISLLRYPVSNRNRTAAAAWTNTPPAAAAPSSTSPRHRKILRGRCWTTSGVLNPLTLRQSGGQKRAINSRQTAATRTAASGSFRGYSFLLSGLQESQISLSFSAATGEYSPLGAAHGH